ncbi:MAG: hypothetical protein K2Q10_13195, partial [Rhodospirillales bacterium]|nr:hypothetical protein [Rhodospirillales bacterium]
MSQPARAMNDIDPGLKNRIANLIQATRQCDIPQVLTLRRLTLKDPDTLKWASEKQLKVVFNVVLTANLERLGRTRLEELQLVQFEDLLPPLSPHYPASLREDDREVLGNVAMQALASLMVKGGGETVAAPPPAPHAPMRIDPRPAAAAPAVPPEAAKAPPAQPAETKPEAKPETPAGPVDFSKMFDDTLCTYIRDILDLLSVASPPPNMILPYPVAPGFSKVMEEVMRRMILPSIRDTRHVKAMATSHNWDLLGGAKLVEIINAGEVNNPVLYHWDTRWTAMRPKPAAKGAKPAAKGTNDQPWPLFRTAGQKHGFTPPDENDLPLLQDLMRFDPAQLGEAWRALGQLYQQEFEPARGEQGREGSFRDGLNKWADKMPNHAGEFLAIRSCFLWPRLGGIEFLKRFSHNFGKT